MAHAVIFHLPLEEKFTRTLVQPMVMVVFHGAIQHQTMQVYQSGETVCQVMIDSERLNLVLSSRYQYTTDMSVIKCVKYMESRGQTIVSIKKAFVRPSIKNHTVYHEIQHTKNLSATIICTLTSSHNFVINLLHQFFVAVQSTTSPMIPKSAGAGNFCILM